MPSMNRWTKSLIIIFLSLVIVGFGPDFEPFSIYGLKSVVSRPFSMVRQNIDISQIEAASYLFQNVAGLKVSLKRSEGWLIQLKSLGLAVREPLEIIKMNMRVLAQTEEAEQEGENKEEGGIEEQEPQLVEQPSQIKIIIYCTHNAETYYPEEHKSHSEKGLINVVAKGLAESLEEKGAEVIYDDTVHDSPDYALSYLRSRQTVERLLEQHPDVSAVFDVHRDSIPERKEGVTTMVEGRRAAQVLLVVGSDERKPNPYWKQNLSMAEKMLRIGNTKYPGLIRGVRLRPGTYNQDLHPKSVLLEIGNEYNTLEEAVYGARLLSNIILETLAEEV